MAKHKKSKQINKKKQKKTKSPQKIPSVEELLQAGDAASASPDKALAFYQSAVDVLKPDTTTELHVTALEKLGEVKASLGDTESARQQFQAAIQLLVGAPRTNPSVQETLAGLHLYMGQLSEEQEALEAYQKGLQCLEQSVQLRQQECANSPVVAVAPAAAAAAAVSEEDEDQQMETDDTETKEKSEQYNPHVALNEARQKLASARVTVAELYLTDLCFEENAEQECEQHVQKALEVKDDRDGEPMVDALQTAASLRLSQQRPQDALVLILRAYQKIQVGCEALASLVGLGDSTKSKELVQVDAAQQLPTLEFRSQTAKLLLECGAVSAPEASKCPAAAIQVLGSLMAENDEVPEVWYLLGCAFEASNNKDNAKYYWNKALELLTALQKQMEEASDSMDNDDDEGDELEMQLQQIASQMEEIQSKLEDVAEEEEQGGDTKMEE